MEVQNCLFELSGGVAVLTVNRPDKRNALDAATWRALLDFFRWADTAPQVSVVILTGAGDKAFIAGADLNSLAVKRPADCLDNVAQAALEQIERCSKPVIAAVNGLAFGGGCETALACDFRVAAENALFALPETGLGILPGAGGTQRLARLIGLGRAKDVILLGRQITAPQAVQMGLASQCVPLDQLMPAARAMAAKLMARGPVALRVAKRVLNASLSTGQDVGLLMETLALSALCGTGDKAEGVSSFLERRTPQYKNQ